MSKTIAYYSLEFAVEEKLPIYAGGLGILAADVLLEAGSQGKEFVGLGMFYCHGFHAHQPTDTDCLDPNAVGFSLLKDNSGRVIKFSSPLENREVWFQTWFKAYGSAKLFLIDTNVTENSKDDQKITEHLYGPDHDTMLKQQIILALGSIKVLNSQNITPQIFHLNEGHTAMAILPLASKYLSQNPATSLKETLKKVSRQVVATKHTILSGGGMHISKEKLKLLLGTYLESQKIALDELFDLGTHQTHPNTFSTTNFLLRFSARTSAVSLAHALAEKKIHPHSQLTPITNGVNQKRWQHNPSSLNSLKDLNDLSLWTLHQENKTSMIDYLKQKVNQALDINVLTVVWARRFTSYKRPELLFNNLDELSNMTKLLPATQFVIAGQTNPTDAEASELAERIKRNLEEKQLSTRIIFLTEYDLTIAQKLVAGADVWLNTPIPGMEASGTSGMKSGLNGVLQFTTGDGWAQEINWDSFGWILPEENIADRLYSILEQQIIPIYYKVDQNHLPTDWITKMRKTISLVEENYTTKRLLADYFDKLYQLD